MRIIAYTYEADVHCVACTQARFSKPSGDYDTNGIGYKQEDREGNLVHPVFSTDEHDFTNCGDCHEELT